MSVVHLAHQHHAAHPAAAGPQQPQNTGNSARPNAKLPLSGSPNQFQQELSSQLVSSQPAPSIKKTSTNLQQPSGGATDTSYNGWNPTTGTISPAVADIAARDASLDKALATT